MTDQAGKGVLKEVRGSARPKTKYSVYVVQLDSRRLFEKGRCPSVDTKCVYVGQTSKTPDERLAQHKAGIHAARVVRDFGIRLRPGLTRDIGPFDTEKDSLRAERRLANKLKARKGYKVWGGQGKKFMASAKASVRRPPPSTPRTVARLATSNSRKQKRGEFDR